MADETMSETPTNRTGVFITLREIHDAVTALNDKLDTRLDKANEEISKIKTQIAALAVVNGILITTIAFLIQKGLTA